MKPKTLTLALIIVAALLVPTSVTFAYSGTVNITAATPSDARVDPNASVNWTVGPILNATGSPIGTGNSSLNFDGSDDYVNCGSMASIDDLTQFTWEAWVRPVTGGDDYPRIFHKTSKFLFIRNNGNIAFTIQAATTNGQASKSGTVSLNQWIHVAVTYDDAGDRKPILYLNGVFLSGQTQIAAVGALTSDAAANLNLGGITTTESYKGKIDEARIYNRTLTPIEILQHYQGIYQNETGLVLYLDFDGQTQDQSGNGNHGTPINGPTYTDGWAACPVTTSYNGTTGTTAILVNSTTGICTIPDTAPTAVGTYSVETTSPAGAGNYTYTGFIVDSYLVNVYSLYETTEEGFQTLLYADGESLIDGHQLTSGDGLTIEGVVFTWNTYTSRFEATDSESTPQTKTYDTLTALSEATYGITSGSMNVTATVTWTQGTLERIQTHFQTGDWIGAILGEYVYTMGTLFFYTALMTILSVGIYNVGGAYATIFAWILGWGVFSGVVHGQGQIIGYIFILIGVAIAIVKLTLDRRTT